MSIIQHSDSINADELAKLAREAGEVIEANEDRDDVEEAYSDLKILAEPLGDLGYASVLDNDWKGIESAYEAIGRDGGVFIADSAFADYIKNDYIELAQIPEGIIPYVNWEDFADDYKTDYSEIDLDDVGYKIRLG